MEKWRGYLDGVSHHEISHNKISLSFPLFIDLTPAVTENFLFVYPTISLYSSAQ